MLAMFHPFTYFSVMFCLVAILLQFGAYQSFASLGAGVAFLFALQGQRKQATPPQWAACWLSGMLTAALLYLLPHGNLPLAMAALFATTAALIRFQFLGFFTHTRFLWLEPLLAALALALYLVANSLLTPTWQAWVVPLPILASGSLIAYFSWKDGKGMLKQGSSGVEPGQPAPAFSLPNQQGKLVQISDFKGRNLLLVFVRGDWCPSCHVTLRAYERQRQRFQEKNVVVLAIGPDPIGVNQAMVQKLGVEYEVLSDENQQTAMAYGVQNDNAVSKMVFKEGLPLPASFLIDGNGIIRYTSRPDRVGEFLNPATIFPILETL